MTNVCIKAQLFLVAGVYIKMWSLSSLTFHLRTFLAIFGYLLKTAMCLSIGTLFSTLNLSKCLEAIPVKRISSAMTDFYSLSLVKQAIMLLRHELIWYLASDLAFPSLHFSIVWMQDFLRRLSYLFEQILYLY